MSSSPFLARWLFRALLGAAFGRLGWEEFWKWALPPKRGAMSITNFNQIMVSHYLEPMKEQLRGNSMILPIAGSAFSQVMDKEIKGAVHDHMMDANRYLTIIKPTPISWKRRQYNRLKYKFKRRLPVITTRGSLEDMERDY